MWRGQYVQSDLWGALGLDARVFPHDDPRLSVCPIIAALSGPHEEEREREDWWEHEGIIKIPR